MTSLSALADTTFITTSSSSSSSSSSSTTAEEELEEDKLSFLNLLLTQLENQNPLDPMDTTEYTSQLVAYSQLEQQMEINSNLQTVSDQLSQSALTTNLSYIGQDVEVESDISPIQDNTASWSYSIDGSASEVYLTVTDADGNTLWSGDGTTASGVNSLNLDMTDSGLDEGTLLYLYVNAVDSDGDSLDSTVTSTATVDGVSSDGTTTYLTAGGMSFTLDSVLKIVS